MILSIIIVSFNTSNLLVSCLNKVSQTLRCAKLLSDSEIIIVDNNSEDNSVEAIKKNFPQIKIIQNKENLGFARANNQGIKISQGKFILFLNSDTELEEESLSKMVRVFSEDSNIGVLGARLVNQDLSIQPSVGFIPHLVKVFYWMFFVDDIPILNNLLKPYHVQNPQFYLKKQNVDWVSGACLLIRKKVLEKVGLFDENIFMYAEEVELCYRVRLSGFSVLYYPDATVLHYKGESGIGKNSGIVEEFTGLIKFYNKYKPEWQLKILKILLAVGSLLRLFIFGILMGKSDKAKLYDEAFKMVRR